MICENLTFSVEQVMAELNVSKATVFKGIPKSKKQQVQCTIKRMVSDRCGGEIVNFFDYIKNDAFFKPLTLKYKRIYYDCIQILIDKTKELRWLKNRDLLTR